MDSLTHIVFGACLGDAIAGKKLGKKAMLWGAIASSIPDTDVITNFWMSRPDALLAHRGFTHSILFALLGAFLFSFLCIKFLKAEKMTFRDWLFVWGSGLFFHIFIDACTAYGTGWFEPFSHSRISFNLLFVADPFYTLSLLIATVALLILKKNSRWRSWWSFFGIGLSSLYVLYACYNKLVAEKVTAKNFQEADFHPIRYFTTPTPLNVFLWYIVAQDSDGFNLGYYSVLDSTSEISFTHLPGNDSILGALRNDKQVQKLVRFSQNYYRMTSDSGNLIFSDLRFGQVEGWANPQAAFVFNYALRESADNDLVIQRGRFEASRRKALGSLIRRICGH
ncbi:MAG: metal-dependent hydrolase [Bacteroidia bacterium]|nr:metal-dependent hydrolase [Bacteroidia bacterium]